ncbi:MAG TPA: 50S ribosomal protein L21 [bacterium]|nr:50S ribosomal protein L21 [bacterium]
MKAVFVAQGKQIIAEAGDLLTIDRLPETEGSIQFSEVLAVIDGEKVTVGTPHVENASVQATVVKQTRGKKIRVLKYKNKINYHVVKGHRQDQTVVKIDKINV